MKNLIYYFLKPAKKLKWAFLLIFLSLTKPIFSQTLPTPLSLAKAIETALKQNRQVRLSQLEELSTQTKRKEANSYLFPQINGSAGLTHNIILPTSFVPASAFGGPEGQVNSAQFGLKNAMNVGVSASQILYNQAVFSGFKVIKTSQEISRLSTKQEKENLVLQVSQVYYAAWVSQAQLNLLQKNLESITKILKISELNYQNGLIRKLDYERVLVSKTNLESQIQALQSNNVQQLNTLKFLLDMPLETNLELSEVLSNTSELVTENIGDVSKQRTDYQRVIKLQALNIQERKVIEAGFYPSLVANFQYSFNWQNNRIRDLPNSPFTFPASLVGVSLQVPIFDGLQKTAKVQQNKIQAQKLEVQRQMIQNNSQVEVANAQNKLNSYQKTLIAQDENQKLATKIYQQTAQEYAQGLASINDLLNQENALHEAQNQYLSALANRLIAEVELKKATGKLVSE
jgi:outer membrane protein